MSEPIRIVKSASGSDLADCLGWLGEEIQERTVRQTREDVADALRDSFLDRSQTSVTYTDTPEDSILDALRNLGAVKGRQRFQRLAERFDNEGISHDFHLGLEFAICMIKDPEFEL